MAYLSIVEKQSIEELLEWAAAIWLVSCSWLS